MTEETPKKRGRPPKPETVEVIVMHKTGIQLDTAMTADGKGEYVKYRARAVMDRAEFDAICALDDVAGREQRLMAL